MDYGSITQGYFQMNTLPIGIIIYMTIMILANKNFEPEITKRFQVPVFMLFLLMIFDNIDYYFLRTNNATVLHIISHVTEYNLRIAILASMSRIAVRNEQFKNKKYLWVPAAICIFICCLAPFTHIVCWYDENGIIQRGPLAYITHFTALLYLIHFLIRGIKLLIQDEKKEESILILVGSSMTGGCTLIEMIFGLKGLLIGAIALIIVFYYLHIHTENFKIDALTGAYNRLSFRADTDKYLGHILGVMMLDLNNLKILNDKDGHDAGDKALKTVAYTTKQILPKGCYLYRTGGDEFTVLCTDDTHNLNLYEIKQSLKEAMKSTKYTWAIGTAKFNSENEELTKVLKRADKEMYEDKAIMKGEINESNT